MINILIVTALLSVQDGTYRPSQEMNLLRQSQLVEMRMQQTKPHYAPYHKIYPPGTGIYWDAQPRFAPPFYYRSSPYIQTFPQFHSQYHPNAFYYQYYYPRPYIFIY